MFQRRQLAIESLPDLIASLEQVEESELQSDISENMLAEMKRIRRNVSRVLSFLGDSAMPSDPEACMAAEEVRRECLLINRMVSRILLLQMIRLPRQSYTKQMTRVIAYYRELAESTRRFCISVDPAHAGDLAMALQISE